MEQHLKNALEALGKANYADYFEEMDKVEMPKMLIFQYNDLKNKFIHGIAQLDNTFNGKLEVFAKLLEETCLAENKAFLDLFPAENLSFYLNKVIEKFKQWQDFFVHIRVNKQVTLLAREITTSSSIREGTVEELRDVISQNEKKMMILGEPGMGKSTSMQYLTQKDAQKLFDTNLKYSAENRIPIYLELRYVDNSIFDLIKEEIEHYLDSKETDITKTVEKMLSEGMFSIFLDGLNETIKDKSYQIAEHIQSFYKKYPNCVYLISSRPQDYLLRPFVQMPVFNLVPMNKAQQQEFLDRNATLEIQTIIVEKAILLPNLEHFLAVPLFLFMLIRVVERTGQVPKNEALIIGAFLEGIFLLEQKKNVLFNQLQTNILLAHLAKQYFQDYNGNARVPYSKVAKYLREKAQIENFALNEEAFLQKMRDLQILDMSEEYRYAFKHQLFLEYYFGIDTEIEL